MSHAPVQAIVFDYGKVLSLSPTLQQWERLASKFSVDQPTFQQQYWGFRDAYDRGEYDGPAYWRKIAEVNSKALHNGDVEQLIHWDNDQWTNVNPEMLDFARRMHGQGMRTAILSNMQHEMLDFMQKKFNWLGEFDVQMYSCEEGMVKPVKEIYLECCKRLGSTPANTLFIDDKTPNVEGAKHAGLQALLFTGDRSDVENYLSLPTR